MEERQKHWDTVYGRKADTELSWYQPEPERSLTLIQDLRLQRDARIIDVGAGTSHLVQRLLERGFENLTVLDISPQALSTLRQHLGEQAARVRFVSGDLLELEELGQFDLWHDRAVFHFLTGAAEQARYAGLAARSVAPGGHLLIATFALDGPERCSGLPVRRYDAEGIASVLGPGFTLIAADREVHVTPDGNSQPFTYALLQRAGARS